MWRRIQDDARRVTQDFVPVQHRDSVMVYLEMLTTLLSGLPSPLRLRRPPLPPRPRTRSEALIQLVSTLQREQAALGPEDAFPLHVRMHWARLTVQLLEIQEYGGEESDQRAFLLQAQRERPEFS